MSRIVCEALEAVIPGTHFRISQVCSVGCTQTELYELDRLSEVMGAAPWVRFSISQVVFCGMHAHAGQRHELDRLSEAMGVTPWARFSISQAAFP